MHRVSRLHIYSVCVFLHRYADRIQTQSSKAPLMEARETSKCPARCAKPATGKWGPSEEGQRSLRGTLCFETSPNFVYYIFSFFQRLLQTFFEFCFQHRVSHFLQGAVQRAAPQGSLTCVCFWGSATRPCSSAASWCGRFYRPILAPIDSIIE